MKRVLDLVGAVLLLLLLGPLMLGLAGLIAVTMGRPVLFRQVRPGRHARLFTIYKFRTMSDTFAADGTLQPDGQRLTPLGAFLRKTSLDELPQLFNVLKGEMSFVGPRPLLEEYLPRYSPRQARRHEVLPGITGWAQVRGRNHLAWDEKFELDIWYVEHRSLWLDLKILLLTVGKVLHCTGVSAVGHATMTPFLGDGAAVAAAEPAPAPENSTL